MDEIDGHDAFKSPDPACTSNTSRKYHLFSVQQKKKRQTLALQLALMMALSKP